MTLHAAGAPVAAAPSETRDARSLLLAALALLSLTLASGSLLRLLLRAERRTWQG